MSFDAVVARPVSKPVSVEYAAAQLGASMPWLRSATGTLAALVPQRWWTHPWPVPLGEMLVTARPREDG